MTLARSRPATRVAGIALVATSAASFGTLAIFARIAYDSGAEPVAVLFLRFSLAAILLAVVMVVRGERWPRGRSLAALIALGGLLYVGQSLSYFTALTYASAGLVALLLYLFPGIVVLLSVTLLGERLTRVKVLALVVAVAGSALMIGSGGGRPLGIVLGVASAITYSLYIIASSQITPRAGAIPSATVIIASAAAIYGLLAAVTRPTFPGGVDGAAAVAGLALVATVVAIVTFFAGLARLGPSETSTLSTIEPMVTVVLAAAVLGESITLLQVAGGALILAAVVLLARA